MLATSKILSRLSRTTRQPARLLRAPLAPSLSVLSPSLLEGAATYSSFTDPSGIFEAKAIPKATTSFASDDEKKSLADADADSAAALRRDVRAMGSLLGKIITQHHGEDIIEKIEFLRHTAKTWRKETSQQDFDEMVKYVEGLTDEELFLVSRAFTHFLAICNAAEAHQRTRRIWQELIEKNQANNGRCNALRDSQDSCGRVFHDLLASEDASVDVKTLYDSICKQKVEFVLTAHPTEVNRRTLLYKKKRIQSLLTDVDELTAMGGATKYQRKEIEDQLERQVTSIWQSDELNRAKPSVQSEASKGTLVIETALWEAVPTFLRKLDATMKEDLGQEYGLPLDCAPVQFSSWMGGDRDGNPNVTALVTREVCLSNRIRAARLFVKDLTEIQARLSTTQCSEEMEAVLMEQLGEVPKEPYRGFLQIVIDRLNATEQWAQGQLDDLAANHKPQSKPSAPPNVYVTRDQLSNDMMLIHRSLCDTNNEVLSTGLVTDVIRNISAFGLTLCPLDIRQEADRHTEALDCITRFLGLGSYAQWDEQTRINWLQQQLSVKRPLMRPGEWSYHPDIFTPTAVDTLETFQMISDQFEDSLGAYVISQATNASDVMAVLLLQRDAGVIKTLRVAPLFETLDDLEGAPENVDRLFSVPAYYSSIAGKQEIMIGYSDSAKDAGRLAASWAQYKTQEALVKVAEKHGIDLTFFHGKGGTVGRGGNPETYRAILAHAPRTINGQFRVTEQGEMIDKNFGIAARAERSLDIYTAAVLAEQHTPRKTPTAEWRNLMEELSETSCAAYRKIVREDPRFVPYFRTSTPELELATMNIGSRPAKRKATGGVESLRAIPWIFAWMQTRLNLPVWLGVGEALSSMLQDSTKGQKLREMYKEWGSFQTTIDMVEMVLAKSEPAIAQHYERTLVKDPLALELGEEIRSVHKMTELNVLDLSGHSDLSENNVLLKRALGVRNPYVDVLNVMQAETLKRSRARAEEGKESSKTLQDALRTTIAGISNGMGNTG